MSIMSSRIASGVRRFRREEDGGSLVEFAIVFTFMFVPLMFGALEFGRATYVKSSVTAAAREGVRYAIVHGDESGSDTTATKTGVTTYVTGRAKLTPLTITTSFPDGDNLAGMAVKVRVAYIYTPVLTLFTATLGGRTVRIPFMSVDTITSTSKQVISY